MSFKVVSGVCRPQDAETLATYKSIQRQANRFLDQAGKPLLTIDGRLGPKTLAAVNFALGASFPNCSAIADRANAILSNLTGRAESSNLSVVADPESIVRSILSPASSLDAASGQVINPPSIMTAGVGGIPFWLIGVVGVGGYLLMKKKPTKKKKKKARKRRLPKSRVTRTFY